MICFSHTTDEQELKKIWSVCFGDDPAYIDFFFQNLGDRECLIYKQGNEIAAMLFLLQCTLQGYTGRYIFAACTMPGFREKGYMGRLLKYAQEFYQNTCDFLCLVPAQPSLFDYYSKFGFKTYFYHTILELKHNSSAGEPACSLSYRDFLGIRSTQRQTVQWEDKESRFVFEENLFNGGKNFKTKTGYVILREAEDTCEVLEWVSNDYAVEELLPLTNCSRIIARLPVQAQGVKRKNGMIFILNPAANEPLNYISKPYLSLVLD